VLKRIRYFELDYQWKCWMQNSDGTVAMLSVAYLLAFEGGEIQPGDDMEGSEYRWWSLDEMASEDVELIIPPDEIWLLARAVDLYRLWKQEDAADQPGFDLSNRGKSK